MRRICGVFGLVVVLVFAAGSVLAQGDATISSDAGDQGEGVFVPPPCTGLLFSDVTCSTVFDAWIEQLSRDGITAGCGGGAYCPNDTVTRAQMAVFIEKAMRGTASWPTHTVFVWAVPAAAGGIDNQASGQALLAALAAIPSSGPDAPAYDSQWLIKVGPGTFTISTSTLNMRDWVDIEGSGRFITTIQASGSDNPAVVGTSLAQLRDLSALHLGGSSQSVALYASSGSGAVLRNVYLGASGGTGTNVGLWADGGSAVTVEDSTLDGNGLGGQNAYGLYVTNGAQAVVRNCDLNTLNGSGVRAALFASGATAQLTESVIVIPFGGDMLRTDSGGQITANLSRLAYGTVSGSNISCAAIVDGSNVFHASSCL